MLKPSKLKSCKSCKAKFTPSRPLQNVCSIQCSIKLASVKKKEKPLKKEKTRQEVLKIVQSVFNHYIRLRDKDLPCISCGRVTDKPHAGHYRSVGAAPMLRFTELNVNLQCSKCNVFLSGNLIEYRMGLLKKIGQEKLDWLEGKHEPKHYTMDELMRLGAEYKDKVKALKS